MISLKFSDPLDLAHQLKTTAGAKEMKPKNLAIAIIAALAVYLVGCLNMVVRQSGAHDIVVENRASEGSKNEISLHTEREQSGQDANSAQDAKIDPTPAVKAAELAALAASGVPGAVLEKVADALTPDAGKLTEVP